MTVRKRVRDDESIYCFCKTTKDLWLFKEYFVHFKVVTLNKTQIKEAILISEIPKNRSIKIYVLNEEDKKHFIKFHNFVYNILDIDTLSCHKYLLSVNSFGEIFPCCRQVPDLLIGNILDNDIIPKVLQYASSKTCQCSIGRLSTITPIDKVLHINVELASFCNGQCIYCFQRNLPTFNRQVNFYEQLKDFIIQLCPKSIMIFGGEVSVQKKTIKLIDTIKSEIKTEITIASNGNFTDKTREHLKNNVSSFQITFNGFSQRTVNAVSKLRLSRQKYNAEVLKKQGYIVSVKFLLNPINVLELPTFFEWALENLFDHIIIDSTIITPDDYYKTNNWGESVFSKDRTFWIDVFKPIGKRIKEIILRYIYSIKNEKISLLICPEINNYLNIETQFYEDNGIKDNLKAKSVSISTKAWKTLL